MRLIRRGVGVTFALTFTLVATAQALDGGHGAWLPGALMVRFHDRVNGSERARIVAAAGVRLKFKLPLVSNLWEATTTGQVARAASALEGERAVDYAQPDYVDDE